MSQEQLIEEAMDVMGTEEAAAQDAAVEPDTEGAESEAEAADQESQEAAEAYLRDLTEDDVYDRLQQVGDFPTRLQALESRLFGSLGPLNERLQAIEKALGQQTVVDPEGLAPLKEYDEELYKRLSEALPKTVRATPLDESTLQPLLAPMLQQVLDTTAANIAGAFYSVDEIDDMIPAIKDGAFDPQTDRQRAFVDWYGRQPYEVQQALTQIGPDWVRAVRSFERWEKEQTAAKQAKAQANERRLAAGTQPKGKGRKPTPSGPQTQEEAFAAGFQEVFNSLGK